MSRRNWEFQFLGKEILEGAREKNDYHRERLEYWLDERDKAEADLREKGIEVRSHAVTGGNRMTAVLDPEKADWLATANQKYDHHNRMTDEYAMWIELLNRDLERAFMLSPDDVEFFALCGNDVVEEDEAEAVMR